MRYLITTIFISLTLATVAQAEHGSALLIANSDYGQHQLASPAHDVKRVAEALEVAGFHTISTENLGRDDLEDAVKQFADSVATRGTAVIYFAGYALQGEIDGKHDNYLLPTGENFRDAREVVSKGLGVREILGILRERSGSSTNIVIVDGCYAFPERPEEAPLGLVKLQDLGDDTQVILAAKPGEVIEPSDKVSAMASGAEKLVASLPNTSSITPAISPPDKLSAGKKPGDQWVDSRGMVFCWCPPGKFTMGSRENVPGRGDDEDPVEVTLTQGFWMAKYETTKRESTRGGRDGTATHNNHPQDGVHYDDFKGFLKSLNESQRKAGRLPGDWEYALPTEAQWEYACRAGSDAAYCFGDDAAQLQEFGNFADLSLYDAKDNYFGYATRDWNDGHAYAAIVGSYRPNAWGLHDMHGNLWEICGTRYNQQQVGGVDPVGPKDGAWATRGGSWASWPEYCRSAFRHHYSSRDQQSFIGFRVVLRKR